MMSNSFMDENLGHLRDLLHQFTRSELSPDQVLGLRAGLTGFNRLVSFA